MEEAKVKMKEQYEELQKAKAKKTLKLAPSKPAQKDSNEMLNSDEESKGPITKVPAYVLPFDAQVLDPTRQKDVIMGHLKALQQIA